MNSQHVKYLTWKAKYEELEELDLSKVPLLSSLNFNFEFLNKQFKYKVLTKSQVYDTLIERMIFESKKSSDTYIKSFSLITSFANTIHDRDTLYKLIKGDEFTILPKLFIDPQTKDIFCVIDIGDHFQRGYLSRLLFTTNMFSYLVKANKEIFDKSKYLKET